MRFSVFTHVQHVRKDDQFYAYAPYVREMNLWFKHVQHPKVVGPLLENELIADKEPYFTNSLVLKPISSFHLLSIGQALKAIFKIPLIAVEVFSEMKRSEHLHLRCPGNIGLIACVCQIFFPSKPKTAKYAGNWDPNSKQPWSYRLQKWILKNSFLTRNMKVMVYGEWPDSTKNIRPFFTASFSEKEIEKVKEKIFEPPFTFLFVGALVKGKQPEKAIFIIEKLLEKKIPVQLELYGDGPERERLEQYCEANRLTAQVKFKGNRSLEDLKKAYQDAHFVILPSLSEGWPKAIAEGMFFGCIPVASSVSCLPWMLGHGTRGLLLSKSENERSIEEADFSHVNGIISEIEGLLRDPQRLKMMSQASKQWSQQYTTEKFESAIKDLLKESSCE